MPNPKIEIEMDALNAITDRVLSYTPRPKKAKKEKRDGAKSPRVEKEGARVPKPKEC